MCDSFWVVKPIISSLQLSKKLIIYAFAESICIKKCYIVLAQAYKYSTEKSEVQLPSCSFTGEKTATFSVPTNKSLLTPVVTPATRNELDQLIDENTPTSASFNIARSGK